MRRDGFGGPHFASHSHAEALQRRVAGRLALRRHDIALDRAFDSHLLGGRYPSNAGLLPVPSLRTRISRLPKAELPLFRHLYVGIPDSAADVADPRRQRDCATDQHRDRVGKVLWSLYVVALPIASLYLLRVLRRDRYSVLLRLPARLVLLLGSRRLPCDGHRDASLHSRPRARRAMARAEDVATWARAFALVAAAAMLWHALVFAQLLFDFGLLWMLWRADRPRDRLLAPAPMGPSIGLAIAWALVTLRSCPASTPHATDWPPLLDKVIRFFDSIGSAFPSWSSYALLFALLLAIGSMAKSRVPPASASSQGLTWRVENPFAWLCLAAVMSYLAMPNVFLGVEGISNRQPWFAAILVVFAWNPPARALPRAALFAPPASPA